MRTKDIEVGSDYAVEIRGTTRRAKVLATGVEFETFAETRGFRPRKSAVADIRVHLYDYKGE